MSTLYTMIPADTFQTIGLNAGILLADFKPETGEYQREDILFATTGGSNFVATPSYIDFGDDVDNCPKNTKQLKVLETWEVTLSGTAVTMNTRAGKLMTGAADLSDGIITPRADLHLDDFTELWWVGDYDNEQSATKAGFLAIHMFNALNTGGLQIQTNDREKANFAFEITGHYDIDKLDVVPFEFYVQEATTSDDSGDGDGDDDGDVKPNSLSSKKKAA